jgi:adhesin/invasin
VSYTTAFADGSKATQTVHSDNDGKTNVDIASTVAGAATVFATLANGETSTTKINFSNTQADVAHSSLIASQARITADGVASSLLTLTLHDSQDHPVAGQNSVVFTTTGVDGIILSSVRETAPGVYSTKLSGTQTGIATVNVKNGAQNLTGVSTQVELNGDNSTSIIADGALTVVTDHAIANGVAQNSVQVNITDANKNAVSGQAVNFSANNGATIATSAVTDVKGQVLLPVTNTTAGATDITATVNGVSQTVSMTFNSGDESAQIAPGNLIVLVDGKSANNRSHNTVLATVTDGHGNALAGQPVVFTVDGNASVMSSGTTDQNGQLQGWITSPVAGNTYVTATLNQSHQTVPVTFVADDSTAQIVEGGLVNLTDGAVANGIATNSVKVTVTDALNNPVPDTPVTMSVDNNAAIATGEKTDGNGQLIAKITSTTAGTAHVTAFVSGSPQSVAVEFAADSSTATLKATDLTVLNDQALANNSVANRVRVSVTDASGNPVSGQTVSFTASNGATLTDSGPTNIRGRTTATLVSTKAGVSTVSATLNGTTQQVDITFIADESTTQLAVGALTVTSNNAVADGTASNSVRAIVTDQFGNRVRNMTVTFSTDDGATIPPHETTNNNGEAIPTRTSKTAGISTVRATVNGSSRTIQTTFTANADTAYIATGAMSVTDNNAATDGLSSNSVRVVVTDLNGNTLSGQNVTFTATNGATIGTHKTSDEHGVVNMPLTSKTAGDSLVTATVNSQSQSVTVSFVADGSTAQITTGNLETLTTNALANGTALNQVRATVTDASGNPLAGQTVTFSVNYNAVLESADLTDSSGQVTAQFTNRLAGTTTLTATINSGSRSVSTEFIADESTTISPFKPIMRLQTDLPPTSCSLSSPTPTAIACRSRWSP